MGHSVGGCLELVEGVDGEAAEELGVEIGGFLRHDFAGERDVFELVKGDGLDEEGDVGLAGFDERDGFAGLAEVLDVAGRADLVFGEAEEVVEHYDVELRDAELALSWGQVLEKRADGLGFGGEEVVAIAGGGYKRVARRLVELSYEV